MLKVIGYTEGGKPIDSESYQCYAKEEVGGTIPRFYVRAMADNLFDPKGPDEGLAGKKKDGRVMYPFVKVPESTFDFYLQFLKSGLTAYRNAARKDYVLKTS